MHSCHHLEIAFPDSTTIISRSFPSQRSLHSESIFQRFLKFSVNRLPAPKVCYPWEALVLLWYRSQRRVRIPWWSTATRSCGMAGLLGLWKWSFRLPLSTEMSLVWVNTVFNTVKHGFSSRFLWLHGQLSGPWARPSDGRRWCHAGLLAEGLWTRHARG